MSGPARRSIGRALLWFAGLLALALFLLDGGVSVIADRLTLRRDAAVPGPQLAAAPVAAADSKGDKDDESGPLPGVAADRGNILALEDTCIEGAPPDCKKWALDPFYRTLGEAKQRTLGRTLRVSWYGDSVIATDAVPGRLRQLFQTELGDGGPGFVYLVPPHRFCAHEAITRSSTGSWNIHAISTTQIADGLYGVGGSTAETDDGRATIKLNAGSVSHIELYYLAQPRGGSATVLAGGKQVASVATRGATKQAGYAAATVEGGATKIDVIAAGKVRLFGIDLENATGAVVDNFGIVSANVKSLGAQNPEHFQTELAHRAADLVMVMIGANEAEWLGPTDRDTKDYAATYEKFLASVRKARPEAGCLVISPTDQAEAKDGGYVSRAVMPELVLAQRNAARRQGCAFYSTYDWMGGKGSAAKWYRRGMLSTDFQHLSRKGANRLSEALFGTLMAGYQTYAKH